jgi:hypothetical protein
VKWRHAVIGLVVLLTAAVRVAVGIPQTPAPSLTLTGQVDIALGPDGNVLVLVDEATAGNPSDGLVEHVFRLQGADSLAYSGPATVTYTRGRLTVQTTGDTGWAFNIAGRTLPPDPGLTPSAVTGISHSWGENVHQSPAALFSTLSATTCSNATTRALRFGTSSLDGDPTCRNCQGGGLGADSCAVDCDGTSPCDVDCGSGTFACCNCPGDCHCCGDREVGGGGH